MTLYEAIWKNRSEPLLCHTYMLMTISGHQVISVEDFWVLATINSSQKMCITETLL